MRVTILLDRPEFLRSLQRPFRPGRSSSSGVRFRALSTWRDLEEDVRGGGCDLAVLDPFVGSDAGGAHGNLVRLERLAPEWDRDRLIILLPHADVVPKTIPDLGLSGFTFLLIHGIDDHPNAVVRALARARGRQLLRERWRARCPGISEEKAGLLLDMVAGWPPVGSARELATRFHVSRRTLHRRLNKENLPSPGRLVSCGRLLEVCVLWQIGIRNRASLASIVGLSEASSLGHLARRRADRPLGEFLGREADREAAAWIQQEFRA